jgi:hypothetical protein
MFVLLGSRLSQLNVDIDRAMEKYTVRRYKVLHTAGCFNRHQKSHRQSGRVGRTLILVVRLDEMNALVRIAVDNYVMSD